MKYIVILADGMSDWPLAELNGLSPMGAAAKPHMNQLAAGGICGLCQTVPPEFTPGSDVANLALLGYPPEQFYRGRSALEALGAGMEIEYSDLTLRANLVTLSDEAEFLDKRMLDYSGGDVSSADAAALIQAVSAALDDRQTQLFPSVGFRNILLWHNAADDTVYRPAHAMLGGRLRDNLPEGVQADAAVAYMQSAADILSQAPYNRERVAAGLPPANGIWLWGPGKKVALPPFRERYGLAGGIVCGVDLLRGIGRAAGMDVLTRPCFSGSSVTDFAGKGQLAAEYLLSGGDFVYVHIEAPDESSHQGSLAKKIAAIERIDAETLPAVLNPLQAAGEAYRLLITPDHSTSLATRDHVRDAVPFLLFDSRHHRVGKPVRHDEARAAQGVSFADGTALLRHFLDVNFY